MKAQFLKQHLEIINPREIEDCWGDKAYIVNNIQYGNKEKAVKAAKELMEQEFRNRYLMKEVRK